MIPLLQWSVYCCDGSDHVIGWTGGRPIISSTILKFVEPLVITNNDLTYLIHPDSQGVNFQALFLFNRWVRQHNFNNVCLVTKKYYLSDY